MNPPANVKANSEKFLKNWEPINWYPYNSEFVQAGFSLLTHKLKISYVKPC